MSKPFRIFISSTWIDLQPEREAVEKALHRMQRTTFSGMEYFGSRPQTPRDVSLNEVDRSGVYIGIYAHRYGSGITEAEYQRAREQEIPCLLYIKDDNVPVIPAHIDRDPDKMSRLEAFKRNVKQNHTVSFFSSPDQLATQVVTDLHNLLGSAPSTRAEEAKPGSPKFQITITGGQGINIGDDMQVTQHFSTPETPASPADNASSIRLQQLHDNVQQDLELLKDYEDALRYEDDPRRRARYRREIEKLRESAARYKEETASLKAAVSDDDLSSDMQTVLARLQRFMAKLRGNGE